MCQKSCFIFLVILFGPTVLSQNITSVKVGTGVANKMAIQSIVTPDPDDEDEDDLDEDDESSEIDDDGRVYRFKNPRNSPSPLCPRNEEQASLFRQKCLRKCSADDDCKSKKKKCLCDGACGMSCIKPDRECPELPEIELGTVTMSGRLFGDKATYTCQHGYHVVGLASRTCQADGQWAGIAPACKQNIYCLVPPTIDNARHNALPEQNTFDLDSTLQYYCNTGYETNGFPRAKCLAMDGQASWYGPDISCEPKSCGNPAEISHGWHSGDCYTYGCRVQYTCAEGFELVGKKERFCEADGNWSPKELPTCVLVTAVQCAPPDNPRYGKAIYTSCSYNSVVSYECKYGYVLVGEATRRCGADKKWTGHNPVCKEINCGHPGRLWNGWLENIESGTGLGASIIFRCHEGMKLEGHSSTVCQIDGKWRYTLPNCSAPCVVPHVQQGRVYLISRENGTEVQTAISHQTLVQHGEELGVDCEPQYEFFANQTPVACNNGTWTQIPRCEPARCKHMPRSPRNGMVIAPKTDHGMKAIFKCKDGFSLKGTGYVECQYGNWTGDIPYCQEVYCPFPGYIENGKVLLVGNMGLYDYRPYVRKVTNNKQIMYDCDKGYVLGEGPPGATCVGGRWSPKQLPRCLPGQHPRLRWSKRRRRSITDFIKSRMTRTLTNFMDQLKSEPKIESSITDNLEHDEYGTHVTRSLLSFDEDIDEMALEELGIHRKKRSMLSRTNQHTNHLMNRNQGHSGANVRRNPNRGQSAKSDSGSSNNNTLGTKYPKKFRTKGPCDLLSNEPYVEIEVLKTGRDPNMTHSSGTIIRMSCSKGYRLNLPFNTTAKCVRGNWKPTKPECEIIPCTLPEAEYGFYKLFDSVDEIANETVEHGDVVKFACEPGYNIKGISNLKCWHGEWDIPSLPECIPAPCELPSIHNGQYLNGYRAGLTISNGSFINFQCDTFYRKTTSFPIQCLLGSLFPKNPSCRLSRPSLTSSGILAGVELQNLDYKVGSDIHSEVKEDQNARSCGKPGRVHGAIMWRNGEVIDDGDEYFIEGTEIVFDCGDNKWKILCDDGSWIGKSFSCEGTLEQPGIISPQYAVNKSCVFRNNEPNVVSFYNDGEITEDMVEFPSGAILVSRCTDIGKFQMVGSNVRRCTGPDWNVTKPVCFGMNQENDYNMGKPPTILFRHQLGPIAQSNSGKLIVYPGTILHMECLWMRRFGNPKWNISHSYRKYPEGWSTDPGRDSGLEYRLSIIHATKDDSGTFSCVTPARQLHSVEVEVKAIHCPLLTFGKGIITNTKNTKMNTKLELKCNGGELIGAKEIVCLPSGNWSNPFPVCESVECGDVFAPTYFNASFNDELSLANLRVVIVSREVGGRAVFSCTPGFGLRGPGETVCLSTGDWALPFPTCVEVQCDPPGVPENGYIQGNAPYKAGDIVQFNCNPDFMMEGQPIVACQDNSRWSGTIPKCLQACSYPGTTISGRMSAVKFYYKIGETIIFSCDEGLILRGAPMLRCLKNGKWSNAIPTCVNTTTSLTSAAITTKRTLSKSKQILFNL